MDVVYDLDIESVRWRREYSGMVAFSCILWDTI